MVSVNELNSNQKPEKDEVKDKSFKSMSLKERYVFVKELVSIEPLICCLVTAKMISGPAMTNLHFEKACKVNAGFNDTVCEAILDGSYLKKNFNEQNNEVQSYMTNMRSWEVPVSSVVPVLLVLFLGSYSDRHKIRKPFLLVPLVGDMVALAGTFLNIIYMYEWPLEAQVIADRIIPSLFGAEKLIIMVSYAYIADISTPKMRTVRMAVIPILLSICIPVVNAISGVLFAAVGYIPVLCTSFFFFVMGFLYGVFKIKEPEPVKEENISLFKDLFNVKNVAETLQLLVKHKGSQRTNLLCILVLCYIHTTVNSGEQSAFFLFTQTAYQWTVVDFSYFRTIATIINFIGLSVGVPLFAKVFDLNDLTIIIIAYLDAILVSSIYVVVQSPVGLYIGLTLSVLKPPGHAATRSQLTKYVSRDDMAKALSLNTIVSVIAAIVSAQIYHQGIYEHTRKTFPQAFFLFGIAMHLVGVVILIWMYYKEKRDQKNDGEPYNEEQNQIVEEVNEKTIEAYIIEQQIMALESENNFYAVPLADLPEDKKKDMQIANCNEAFIKEIPREKEIIKEKDMTNKNEMAKENEITKEKETAEDGEITKEKDISKEKETAKDNEMTKDREIIKENETKIEKQIQENNHKEVSIEEYLKDGMNIEKQINSLETEVTRM